MCDIMVKEWENMVCYFKLSKKMSKKMRKET